MQSEQDFDHDHCSCCHQCLHLSPPYPAHSALMERSAAAAAVAAVVVGAGAGYMRQLHQHHGDQQHHPSDFSLAEQVPVTSGATFLINPPHHDPT